MREVRDRYEIFLKVCETGNFTKAAEALNYTQSGISQMMAGLEEELGVQLFARAKKGVVLTDNGQRLIPYIREMDKPKGKAAPGGLQHQQQGRGQAAHRQLFERDGDVAAARRTLFKENYPQVEVQIFDGNYDEIHDWIIRGQVDCGFLSSILAEDLTFYPLHQDALCAVLPREHPLAQRSSVTPEELLQYPFIIETPGCDNDILHLLEKYPAQAADRVQLPRRYADRLPSSSTASASRSRRSLAMHAFANKVRSARSCRRASAPSVSRSRCHASSVTARTLLEYLQANLCGA